MPNVRPDGMKCCPRCGETKVAEGNFYRAKSMCDGFGGYCIPCTKAKVVEWQKTNPEKKAAADHKQYATKPARRQKMRERLDRWAAAHPAKVKEVAKAGNSRWKSRHPDRAKAVFARFDRSPKGRARSKKFREKPSTLKSHRERERMRRLTMKTQVAARARLSGSTTAAFSHADWLAVLGWFGHACAYCGVCDEPLEMDHVVPVKVLGPAAHRRGNIVPACKSCNSSKKHRPLTVFCAERGLDAAAVLERAAGRLVDAPPVLAAA